MEILTLPGPAGKLWAAKRDVIHSLPAEAFGQPIRPHIGGGTTLAARWKHRLSTDIDILLPGRNTLIDLLQDDERNVVRRLGGEPEAVTDRRAKIAFTRGKIDLCILKPDPAQGPTRRCWARKRPGHSPTIDTGGSRWRSRAHD